MSEKKSFTHTAYALKRESRTAFRPLEIGSAQAEDGGKGNIQIFLDRLPVGGFDGRIILSPVGVKPVFPEPTPQRPEQAEKGTGEEETF
jgi:hypothetical protein